MFSACLCADFAALVLKNVTTTPPPPNPNISEMPFFHRFQKTYTYPLLWNELLVHWTKIEKTLKRCEFAPCWQVINVPERHANESNTSAVAVHYYHYWHSLLVVSSRIMSIPKALHW